MDSADLARIEDDLDEADAGERIKTTRIRALLADYRRLQHELNRATEPLDGPDLVKVLAYLQSEEANYDNDLPMYGYCWALFRAVQKLGNERLRLAAEVDRLRAITATVRRCHACHLEVIGGRDFEEEPEEPTE